MTICGSFWYDAIVVTDRKRRVARFLAAAAVGAVAGALAGLMVKGVIHRVPRSPGEDRASSKLDSSAKLAETSTWRYVRAFQEGDWDAVIDQTLWMRERLERLRSASGSEEAVSEARMELSRQLSDYRASENQLRPEGVEDQYVFVAGAAVTVAREDAGRDDLEEPAAGRTWFRVEFPVRARALRDTENLPIRAITAGVNVSRDGYVLKANIVGNLDIDMQSISYEWGTNRGG